MKLETDTNLRVGALAVIALLFALFLLILGGMRTITINTEGVGVVLLVFSTVIFFSGVGPLILFNYETLLERRRAFIRTAIGIAFFVCSSLLLL